MCLAVPGKIESVTGEDPLMRTARVNFGGVIKEVSLAYVPDAAVGDYVIVHVGFALNKLDEQDALKVLEDLKALEMEDLADEEAVDGRP